MSSKRWVLANIFASIVGIMVGIAIVYGWMDLLNSWINCSYPSGIPCGTTLVGLIMAGFIGGLVGGMAGYLVSQKLTGRKIAAKYLMRYALLGAFLWPAVGLVGFMGYIRYGIGIVFDSSPLLDGFLPGLLVDAYEYLVGFAFFVILPGVALGGLLSVLRNTEDGNVINRFLEPDPQNPEE